MAGKTGRKKNKQTNKKERKECVHVITVGIGLEKKRGEREEGMECMNRKVKKIYALKMEGGI